MDPRAKLLKTSFETAHMVFNAVVSDLDEETARFILPGGKVPCAATMIAHVLYGQDMMISEFTKGPLVLDSAGFREKTGITVVDASMSPEWLAQEYKLPGLLEYSTSVFARTLEYLSNGTPAELDFVFTTPFGTEATAAEFIGSMGIVHISEHTGEISTLKGACGKVGLPF